MAADTSRSRLRKQEEVLGTPANELVRQRQRKYTVSNAISVSRVLLMPLFVWLMAQPAEDYLWEIVGLSLLIIATDALDGFVARRLNQVSDWGKVFDPVADKLCVAIAAVSLWLHRGLPIWVPAAVIVRDVAIIVGSIVLFRKRDVVLPSNQLGRYTTVVLSLTFFVFAVDWAWPQQVLVWASGILIAATFIVYLRNGIIMLRKLRTT